MSGLPYDEPLESGLQEPALLDRALSDAASTRAGDLLGRMGQGKVYLLEESPAAIAASTEGDGRVRRVARQFQDVDCESWLIEATKYSHSRVRTNALHITGEPLAHMPTDKVFLYATSRGAAPLGIEWINDTTLVLLFEDAQAAMLAIAVLAKAGFDFEDDPLESRSAQHVSPVLLPLPETSEASIVASRSEAVHAGTALAPPVHRSRYDPAPLATGEEQNYADLPVGLRPLARMDVRFAMESDSSKRGKASESKFYEKNGRDAGKHQSGGRWQRGGGGGGRRRDTPYDRPAGRERRQQPTQEDLDRELEGLRSGDVPAGTVASMDVDMDGGRSGRREDGRRSERGRGRRDGGGGGGGGRREKPMVAGKDDLDRELDEMLAGRR